MEKRKIKPRPACLSIGYFLAWFILLVLTTPTTALSQSTLWKSNKDGHVLYLMGSVHVLKKSNYPLAHALEAAYTASDVVAFEVDMAEMESDAAQQLFLQHGIFHNGQTLEQSLTPETFNDLKKYLSTMKLSPNLFARMKPPLCAMTLTIMEMQRLGFDAQYGLDRYFSQKALADGKKMESLETVEFQVNLFFEQTAEEQEIFLKQTLREISLLGDMMPEMEKAWLQGNPAALNSISDDSLGAFPKFRERFLLQRNRNWLTKIKQLHQQNQTTLIIVGAAHLVGEGSVRELLARQGYQFKQL